MELHLIPGSIGYAALADGSIWSCWKTSGRPLYRQVLSGRWHQLRPEVRKCDGRKRYTTRRTGGGYRRSYGSHYVLEAFGNPKPEGMEACHKDGDCTNDAISNLRWGTVKSNKADMRRHGTHMAGESHPAAKLTDEQIALILDRRGSGETLREIAEDFGISQSYVSFLYTKGGRCKTPKTSRRFPLLGESRR